MMYMRPDGAFRHSTFNAYVHKSKRVCWWGLASLVQNPKPCERKNRERQGPLLNARAY